MTSSIRFAIVLLAFAACVPPAAAQSGSTAGAAGSAVQNSGAVPMGNHMGENNMTQDQFNQLSEYVDQSKRLTAKDKANGKTEADLKKEDIAAATALAKSVSLACDVSDAVLVSQSKTGAAYEVACGNGTGYFLLSGDKPSGFSCFTAQARSALDASNGKTDDVVCKLPANADVKKMAADVIGHSGGNCAVKQLAWMGQNPKTNIEYNEAACADGAGYVLATAIPGSSAKPGVFTCAQADAAGLACTLTKSTPPATLTLQTFKDVLAQRGVNCTPSNVRVVGQQNMSKRYVVEFQCPQMPQGLVALIPLNQNTAPFETYNCLTAIKLGVVCKLTAASN